MTKHFRLLLLVFLLVSSSAFAQSNYVPGYVVKLNGDTLKGYIDYHTWIENPKAINFKTRPDTTITAVKFSVANAASFAITGFDRYERFAIMMSHDPVNGFHVSNSVDPKNAVDTVFLKVLDRGKFLTLYSYNDNLKPRFFIAEGIEQPTELSYHAYIAASTPGETKFTATYKRQLESMAVKYRPEDKSLVDEIEAAEYNPDDISKAVFEINGSDKQSTFVAAAQYRARGVIALGTNVLSAHDFGANYVANYSPAIEISAGEDVFLSRTERSVFLRAVFQFAYSGGNKITSATNDTLLERYNAWTLCLDPQLYVNVLSNKNVKLYLAAGFEVFIRSAGTITYEAGSAEQGYVTTPYYAMANVSITTRAELELHNKYGIYFGYDPVSNIGQRYNNVSSIHAGVNYLFGK